MPLSLPCGLRRFASCYDNPAAHAGASRWFHLFSLPGFVPQTQQRQASLCHSTQPTAPAPIPVIALLAVRPCQIVPFRSEPTASPLLSLLVACGHAISPSACFQLCALALMSATYVFFSLLRTDVSDSQRLSPACIRRHTQPPSLLFHSWTTPARTDVGTHHRGFLRDYALSHWAISLSLIIPPPTPAIPMRFNSEERLVAQPACAPQEPPGPKRPRCASLNPLRMTESNACSEIARALVWTLQLTLACLRHVSDGLWLSSRF